MLEIQSVTTFYGNIRALNQVSLVVNDGEIVSLIGANGAGKTTLLNTISGVVPPSNGAISFSGTAITRFPPEEIVRLGISQVPERRQVFGILSVKDNLTLGAFVRLRKGERKAVMDDLDYVFEIFPILKERQKQMGGTLSGGEQQMLAIARSLMARPKLLLLDEPSLGLAPLLVREIFEIIATLQQSGTTILLVEQNARAALHVANRAYVLETGEIVMEGSAADLAADEGIQRAYLGRQNHGKLSKKE